MLQHLLFPVLAFREHVLGLRTLGLLFLLRILLPVFLLDLPLLLPHVPVSLIHLFVKNLFVEILYRDLFLQRLFVLLNEV